jgi:hypothetical protein
MLDGTKELSTAVVNELVHSLSRTSNDTSTSSTSWWDDDDISFGEESLLDNGESDKQLEHVRRSQTCDCIDGVLAILSSPMDNRRTSPTDFSSPTTILPLQFPVGAFDKPPVRPRRSFDGGLEDFARRSTNEMIRDRFQLSRSEHISRSFRAPRRPSRGFETAMDDQQADGGETTARPNLVTRLDSSRDFCLVPPTRIYSEVPEKVPSTKTLSMSTDMHDKITLRSAGRVLLGSRELSTSQHLRRQCPAIGSISSK